MLFHSNVRVIAQTLGVNLALLLAATPLVQAQDNFLQTHVTRLGSDPALVRNVNGTTTPVTDASTAIYSNFTAAADFANLSLNLSTVMPSTPTSTSASLSVYSKWDDGFNFTPSDSLLVGNGAVARFTFQLSGNWDYSLAAAASGSSISYDLTAAGTELQGSHSVNSGNFGEINIGNIDVFTVDQPFNLGSHFMIETFLSGGSVLHNVDGDSSFANLNLRLITLGVEVVNGSNVTIPGSWTTDSGHDYTIAPIPEPATWVLVPGMLGLGAVVLRRRKKN